MLGALVSTGLTAALLGGCGAADASSHPTWVPQPSISPVQLPHQIPDEPSSAGASSPAPASPSQPSQSPGSSAPAPSPASPNPSATADPNVVATKLSAPTGLAVLPDGTALVAERASGRILLVQPVAGSPAQPVKTLQGLDVRGSGGVLDLALSASYGEDGLILALITTSTDIRVVHFSLTGAVTPILTGIPRAAAGNSGRLVVRADGSILVGIGDAGRPTLADDPRSLAGKVLRIDDLGRPAPGNPTAGSRVYSAGHNRVDGLCTAPTGSTVFDVEAGTRDEINSLKPGGSYSSAGTPPIATPTVTKGATGCAVGAGVLYVTGLGGKDVFSAPILGAGSVGTFSPMLAGKYGRLRTVVAASDGSLWLTTTNRDGQGSPVADDERVLHIRPSGGGGGKNPV